jgi:CTP:molybdopterin cytidylyltransferase MocA
VIAGVVLAAGASRRLGTPKQLVWLGRQTLLERAARVAEEAGLAPVLVVISVVQFAEFRAVKLVGSTVLLNEAAEEGMASSIRLGVKAAADAGAEGVVILACDQPAVTGAHLRELMEGGAEVMASSYAGRRGVPAYFPAAAFGELMELRGDTGARELLKAARCVELPGGELDVDTVEDLERAKQLFG